MYHNYDERSDGSKEIALKWCDFDERFYIFQVEWWFEKCKKCRIKVFCRRIIYNLRMIYPTKFEQQLIDLQDAQVSISNYFSFVDGNIEYKQLHRYISPFVLETNFRKEII
jgi:hypothetical protein